MNKYESIIIINPNCTDEALKALESKFTGLINENGKVESYENQGKKKLAYEVKKNKEGPGCFFQPSGPAIFTNFLFLLRV